MSRRYTTPKGVRNGIAKLTAAAVSGARPVYVPGCRLVSRTRLEIK